MPAGRKRVRIALIVLLLLLLAGGAAYWAGLHFWGTYHYRAAEQALERRDFVEADGHLKKCLDASPDNLAWRLLAAQTARRQGDYRAALDHLSVYQQKGGSEEALARERKLVLAQQQGDPALIEPLLSSCEGRPDGPDTPLVLEAVIQGIQNGMKKAGVSKPPPQVLARSRGAVDLWLRLRPGPADQAQGLVWRAYFLRLGDDRRAAVADLRKALELDPDHFEARLTLAELVAPEDPEEAAGHLEALRRRHPNDNQVRYALALVRRSLGQSDEARQLLDDVLASEPDHAAALVARGQIALDAQQPAEAERWLRRAWDLEPDEPETNLALSNCLKMTGHADEAKTYEERFLRIKAQRKQKVIDPTHRE
jgi:tetratricopeptide (TPR) repeat protein